MQNQLTREEIERLKTSTVPATEQPTIAKLIAYAESKLEDADTLHWQTENQIPPRPWKLSNSGYFVDANDATVPSSERINQFIVDRVNAGEGGEVETGDGVQQANRALSESWPAIKADYDLTFSQAHAILDKLGVPKAVHAECNDPECNSQLVHRLKNFAQTYKQAVLRAERLCPHGN